MWIVRLALRRTYTFVVMALLIVAVSVVAMNRMSTDIFPEINIPVVSVVWPVRRDGRDRRQGGAHGAPVGAL